jgi:hypothetical protein
MWVKAKLTVQYTSSRGLAMMAVAGRVDVDTSREMQTRGWLDARRQFTEAEELVQAL